IKLKKLVNEKTFNRVLVGVITVSLVFGVGGQLYAPAAASVAPGMNPGGVPDYFGTVPNYANSPLPEVDSSGNVIPGTGIRKFVDSLPGLGAANANNLGNYLPVGVPDTTTYPGSDYYEINLVEYSQKLHSDLPQTKLRGYVQVNTTDPTVSKPSYMGPIIVAQKDRPVRIKFTNKLPIGEAGDLFLPVDTTLMGAGMGPNGVDMYTQNRATLHLHGGITPWISDGSPHQWITPAGENTPYPTGVSVKNVPDMPDPGPGSMTFFYSNQQSARLMFYHDHSYGLTRLNVYAGEAAGYMIKDDAEKALIASGDIPSDEIPLIIQDKTFVPNDTQLAKEDPTWDTAKWGGMGNLWFPHVYMPNQNPYDNSGANTMGRWDYGPWFWPPYTGLQYGPVANPLAGINGEPPMNPGVPNVSIVPESFLDTPVINGAAYPYLDVQPKPYRFKILNAANDRFFNLQLYTAKSNSKMWNANGALADSDAGEVNMVDAVKTAGYPATWPTDGRDGGVPDPAAIGPNIVQIGTEGGLLTTPAVIPAQPIDYVYNRRDIIVLSVSSKSLFMGPAERADVVIDFTKYAGKTLILYNDSAAPVPAFDPRNDYYTGNPDLTSSGGAPTTLPGYGPNTRTIMQIKVAAAPAPGYKLSDIKVTNAGTGYTSPVVTIDAPVATSGVTTATATATALSAVDAITANNVGSGYSTAPLVTLTGGGSKTPATAKATIKIANIAISSSGVGYKTAPAVTINDSAGGTGTGASAKATLSLTGISLTTPGTGYTSVPTVAISDSAGGTGTGANATATIDPASGAVTGISITSAGIGYTTPIVTITGGGATTSATATVLGKLDNIMLTSPGTGYTTPIISLTGGGATTSATAVITSVVDKILIISPGASYTSAPTVAISGGGATTNATATATIKIVAFNLTNEGKGYLVAPAVHITDITGTGALATATLGEPLALLNKSVPIALLKIKLN
ncbi:hypothetical protein JYT70_00390, partial [bacterium AH-315-N14]|nr:hypothetical protein [bacterium AH-315-N14]